MSNSHKTKILVLHKKTHSDIRSSRSAQRPRTTRQRRTSRPQQAQQLNRAARRPGAAIRPHRGHRTEPQPRHRRQAARRRQLRYQKAQPPRRTHSAAQGHQGEFGPGKQSEHSLLPLVRQYRHVGYLCSNEDKVIDALVYYRLV